MEVKYGRYYVFRFTEKETEPGVLLCTCNPSYSGLRQEDFLISGAGYSSSQSVTPATRESESKTIIDGSRGRAPVHQVEALSSETRTPQNKTNKNFKKLGK